MKQRALTIAVELEPGLEHAARSRLRGLQAAGARLARLPSLHFACWFVLDGVRDAAGKQHPPLLVLEANFDGDRHAFLEELVSAQRSVLDCIYEGAVGYPGSNAAAAEIVSYLAENNRGTDLFYVGCPGKTVTQIEADANFRPELQRFVARLPAGSGRRSELARAVWDRMPGAKAEPAKQPFWVKHTLRGGILRGLFNLVRWPLLGLGILAALLALLGDAVGFDAPPDFGGIARRVMRGIACLVAIVSLLWFALLLWNQPQRIRFGARLGAFARQLWRIAWGSVLLTPLALALSGLVSLAWWKWDALMLVYWVLVGAVLVLALVLGVALCAIARKEQTDDVIDLDYEPKLMALRERENLAPQNHFICLHEIKPGWLRMLTLRAVFAFLQLAVNVYYNRGDLGGISSIHFGRWTILCDRRQLLFATNFDGTWNGYLGEFVNRAARGVTSVWTNTMLFPRTHFLLGDGCRDEQRFKCWARSGEVETLYWVRSYEHSVAAIVRNDTLRREIADFGERLDAKREISEAELDAWLRRL
jgi:hypothetical protein